MIVGVQVLISFVLLIFKLIYIWLLDLISNAEFKGIWSIGLPANVIIEDVKL